MYRAVAFMLAPLAFAGCADAQGTIYKHTDAGWEIQVDSKSCAMYGDFPSGTVLRISNRVDEDRLYVSLLNQKWKLLRGRSGDPAMVYIKFEKQKLWYGSGGVIIALDDESLGYSGSENWGRTELLQSFALEEDAVISVREGGGPLNEIERFSMAGAREAVEHLIKCSEINFGGKPMSLPRAPVTAPAEVAKTDPSTNSLRPYYPLLKQYRSCVIAAAARFSKTHETADLLARSALRSCASARQRVSVAFGSVLGSRQGERLLSRFEEEFVQDAQLEIVRRRTDLR